MSKWDNQKTGDLFKAILTLKNTQEAKKIFDHQFEHKHSLIKTLGIS